jgi:hypothetical protein
MEDLTCQAWAQGYLELDGYQRNEPEMEDLTCQAGAQRIL